MLVGAEPDRPSASYKLNTLVSNTIRQTPSGKAESPEEALPSTRHPPLPPGRLWSCGRNMCFGVEQAWLQILAPLLYPLHALGQAPDLSESASPYGKWAQSSPHRAPVSEDEIKAMHNEHRGGTGMWSANACILPTSSLPLAIDSTPLLHVPLPFKPPHHPWRFLLTAELHQRLLGRSS